MAVNLPQPGSRFYGSYRWAVVFMLWMICVLNYADRQAIFSIFTVLQKEYGLNKKELGLIGSAFMIVYAGLSPLAGITGDRFKRKWTIISGLYIWSLFTGFTTLCSHFYQFIFVRGAEGLGETFYFPASTSLMSDYHGTRTRSRALGFHHTGTYIGTIVGGVLTGWLAQKYGWHTPFYILGGCGVFLGLVLMLLIREPARDEAGIIPKSPAHKGSQFQKFDKAEKNINSTEEKVPLKQFIPELLKNTPALLLAAVFFLANFVTLPFYAWLPTFISEKFHRDLAQSAFAGTFYLQASSTLGAVFGGFVADRWRNISMGGRVLTQAIGVLFYAPFMFVIGSTENFSTLVVVMICLGLFKGMYDSNVWAAFYDVVPVSRRGTICGFANTLAWVGGSISVFLVGLIADSKLLTMSQTFQCFPFLNILMTILLIFAARQISRLSLSKNLSQKSGGL